MEEYKSPVYNVIAVPVEKVVANTYNPNIVAPPEMKLLELSIWEDGYTMPFVFRILALELGENMMVPIGWTGSLSVLFMRPLVISWK